MGARRNAWRNASAWVECTNIPVHLHVFFEVIAVIAVFSSSHPLLNLHGQLHFTLDLHCTDKTGLKGTEADLLAWL